MYYNLFLISPVTKFVDFTPKCFSRNPNVVHFSLTPLGFVSDKFLHEGRFFSYNPVL